MPYKKGICCNFPIFIFEEFLELCIGNNVSFFLYIRIKLSYKSSVTKGAQGFPKKGIFGKTIKKTVKSSTKLQVLSKKVCKKAFDFYYSI